MVNKETESPEQVQSTASAQSSTPATGQPVPRPVGYEDMSPRNYLAVVALAMFTAPLGLARWYRGDEIGKIRFWIAVGCYATLIIPFVNLISILGILVLQVWGIIDFFLLASTTTDANNTPYVATQRDISWAKGLKIAYIVILVIAAMMIVLYLLLLVLGVLTIYSLNSALDENTHMLNLYN